MQRPRIFGIVNVTFQNWWAAPCFNTRRVTQRHHSGAWLPFCDVTNREHVARRENSLKMLKCVPPHYVLMSERATRLSCNCLCFFDLPGQSTHVCVCVSF